MKNLANCKPSEFIKQTSRIRKSVDRWLTDTDIMNIRKRMPKLADDVSAEDRKKAYEAQASANLAAILDAVMDEHPDETLEVLALLCFVEPEHVDDHEMTEYLAAAAELMSNEAVLGFFTALADLGSRLG